MRGFLVLLVFLCVSFVNGINAGAKETEWEDSISLGEVQQVFDGLQGTDSDFSIEKYVAAVMAGEQKFSIKSLADQAAEQILQQIENQKSTFFRILALGLLAGVFANFSGVLGEQSLGETGFYVTYLLLFATMAGGFYTVYQLAKETMDGVLAFMKTLVPSFSLALCIGSGSGTSLAYYETMLIAISIMESLMTYILLPGVQIYFFLSMLNLLSDNRFHRLTQLIRSFLQWCVKILFGILIGYQGIQGLLLPVLDRLKNNTVWQTAKGLPGVGNTVGSLADTVVGSSILLKSAVGIGGMVCILILCGYPLLKLLVFMGMYQIGSAVVQPVSDRRIVAAMQSAAESGRLLLGYVFAGSMLFILSIIIVLLCTNCLG